MKKYILCSLILSVSSQAFAVCQGERDQYEGSSRRCRDLTAAAEAASVGGGILGAIFSIPTFGLSLAGGGLAATVPALAANNACRIMRERLQYLNACEETVVRNAERAKMDADQASGIRHYEKVRQMDRQRWTCNVHSIFDGEIRDAERLHKDEIVAFIQNLVDQGQDVESPEVKEIIRETREDLRKTLNVRLDQIEKERRETLAKI